MLNRQGIRRKGREMALVWHKKSSPRGGYRGGGGHSPPPLNLEFFVPIFRIASQ